MKKLIDITNSFRNEEISAEETIKLVENYIRLNLSAKNTKLSKFDFYKYASTDAHRPVMTGVYFDNGFKVASDAYVLVAIEEEYDKQFEGKIINKKGEVIEGKYPNYKSVIPQTNEKFEIDLDLDKAKKAIDKSKVNKKMNKFIKEDMHIKINGIFFKTYLFELFIVACKQLKNVKIYDMSEKNQFLAHGLNGDCVIMKTIITEKGLKDTSRNLDIVEY